MRRIQYGRSLRATERVRGQQRPVRGQDLEPGSVRGAQPDACARVRMGHAVAAPLVGDHTVPAHLAGEFVDTDVPGRRQGREEGRLLGEARQRRLMGVVRAHVQHFGLEAREALTEVIEAPPGVPLDEMLREVEKGPFGLALRPGPTGLAGDRLETIVPTQRKKLRIPPKVTGVSIEHKGPRIVDQQRLGDAAEVPEGLFQRLEDRRLCGIQAHRVMQASAVAQHGFVQHDAGERAAERDRVVGPVELALDARGRLEALGDPRVRPSRPQTRPRPVEGRRGAFVAPGANFVEDPAPDEVLLAGHLLHERGEGREVGICDRFPLVAGRLSTAQRTADGLTGKVQVTSDRTDRVSLSIEMTNRGPRFQ